MQEKESITVVPCRLKIVTQDNYSETLSKLVMKKVTLMTEFSICNSQLLNRGSYMSAHVLLNLLNKLGGKIRCEAVPSILSVFPNKFNKFNNTGA